MAWMARGEKGPPRSDYHMLGPRKSKIGLRGQSYLGYIDRYHEGPSVYQLGWNAGGPFPDPAGSPQTPFRSFFR